MKTKVLILSFALGAMLVFSSCSKNQKSTGSNNTGRLQIGLTDSPDPSVKEVWVDVEQIEIIMGDSSKPIILNGSHPGVYNLLALTNGKDTLLADATIPAGNISQIRLILGENNFVVTGTGYKIPLKTPSAQQSGLKVQIHQEVAGGILYRLTLDFDVARSVVFAGNSGQVLLKPVLRIISFVPSGGNIEGVVVPDSVSTYVFAMQGTDTIASTSTDVTNGNFLIKDIPAGNYIVSIVPSDTTYKPVLINSSVSLGQITLLDTVKLEH
jgi:Domain of unknown function (DUF4382)